MQIYAQDAICWPWLLTILVCAGFGAASTESAECLENAEKIRRFFNGSDYPAAGNLRLDLCLCANKLWEKTAANWDNYEFCMRHIRDIHYDYFDAAFALVGVNCTNVDEFRKFIAETSLHDNCDHLKPPTGIIISDPRPPTVYPGIGWIAFCAIVVVAIFVFGTILGVLYSRARRNNGSFDFKYFSKTEDDGRNESDVIIVA